MKTLQICAALCLIVGFNQASDRGSRGYGGPISKLGTGLFGGLESKQRLNEQIVNGNIGGNREPNNKLFRDVDIGNFGSGLGLSLVSDKSEHIRREFGINESNNFGIHVNTGGSLIGKSATVHQGLSSTFKNSTHTSSGVQFGIKTGSSGSIRYGANMRNSYDMTSHEAAHIQNIKSTLNGNKNRLIVLLSSGNIAVSSQNYTSNLQKGGFGASNTRSTGLKSSANSDISKIAYTSYSNTANGNMGYGTISGGYQPVSNNNNNRNLIVYGVVGTHKQQFPNSARQGDNFIKSTSSATRGNSEILKAARTHLVHRPLQYSTSGHNGIDISRRFNLNTSPNGSDKYGETGTDVYVANGSNFDSAFENSVGGHLTNAGSSNTNNMQTSGKNGYDIIETHKGSSSNSNPGNAKSFSSVFGSNKSPEVGLIHGNIGITSHTKDHNSHQGTSEVHGHSHMNTDTIKIQGSDSGTQIHDNHLILNKNRGHQGTYSGMQRRYESKRDGYDTHLGDSETRIGQWITSSENDRDDDHKSNPEGIEALGSQRADSKTYRNSMSESVHNPSHWSINGEHKRQFGVSENHKNHWIENGEYGRNLENTQNNISYLDSSEIRNSHHSSRSEAHGTQSSENEESEIYLKSTNGHGDSWNSRGRYENNEGRGNDWENSSHRRRVKANNVNNNINAYGDSVNHDVNKNNNHFNDNKHGNYNKGFRNNFGSHSQSASIHTVSKDQARHQGSDENHSNHHENNWEHLNNRHDATTSNINRHDNNTYRQRIDDIHIKNNYENNKHGSHSYGPNLHNIGSHSNTTSFNATNEGHENNWRSDKTHSTNCVDNINHSNQEASDDKGYNNEWGAHENHLSTSAGDESYRWHSIGDKYNQRILDSREGHQIHSSNQPNSENHKNHRVDINGHKDYRSGIAGHEKFLTGTIEHGSSSDNIGVTKGSHGYSNREYTSHSDRNKDRENYGAASDNYGHQLSFSKNQGSNQDSSEGYGVSSTGSEDRANYWGSIGVYASHSSSKKGYNSYWDGTNDQRRHLGGSELYASHWSGSVGYINQWDGTGKRESHSSGSAAYSNHWADSAGQRSHSTGSVGYISHWGINGKPESTHSSSSTGH